MKRLIVIPALLWMFSVQASIIHMGVILVNFTNSPSLITNVTWSDPEKISTSTNGLGWGGATNAYRDFWLQGQPVAVGTSWRPARRLGMTISTEPSIGRFFVRYSPDKKHWSSWQSIGSAQETVEVPRMASAEYDKLLLEYSSRDVPWKSDEEAAVKWILQRDPKFFERNQPFIGYFQFRMEGSLRGDIRIKKIVIEYYWSVSGLHNPPKDPASHLHRDGPWAFEAQ